MKRITITLYTPKELWNMLVLWLWGIFVYPYRIQVANLLNEMEKEVLGQIKGVSQTINTSDELAFVDPNVRSIVTESVIELHEEVEETIQLYNHLVFNAPYELRYYGRKTKH